MDEIKKLIEAQGKAFEEFKRANDKELSELKAKGHADPTLTASVEKANAEVGRLQKEIDELAKKMQAPGKTHASEEDETRAAHRKAFGGAGGYLRKGNVGDLADLQVKALSVAVDGDGGYAVPEELDRQIGAMERQLAPMEAEVTSLTAGAETYEKLLTDGMAASGWVGESDARTETGTPTLASFKPLYGELYANPKASQKMLDDAFFDVEAWLAGEVGEKFGADLDLALISGDGTKKPKRILAYTLAVTGDATRAYGTIQKKHSGTAGGGLTADFLIDLVHLLRAGYRIGAKWLMAGTTLAAIRKLKDTTGQLLFQPSLVVGQPATLLGYGIIEDDNMPIIAADANVLAFGNFKRAYKLVNIRGVRTLRDPYTAKPHVQFYTTKRVGGGVEDTRAIKVGTLSL